MSGTLYVVATPIGNLDDLTLRAATTLKTVDRVAAEDTRRTKTLLAHLGVRATPISRLDAHSTDATLDRLLGALEAGQSIALVTDAGTPGVSDPGAALVRAAAERQIAVIPLPGPSAVTTAIAVSGLVEGPFSFLGFLPRKGEKRRQALARIAATREPVVLFEAPGRTAATLAELARAMPERPACLARELTKLHEEVLRGSLSAVAEACPATVRGEVTLVLGAMDGPAEAPAAGKPADLDALVREGLAAGTTPKDLARKLATELGRSRREVYQRILALQGD